MKKKGILCIFSILIIGGASYLGYLINTQKLYKEYLNLFEYRRLNPDSLPNIESIRLTSAGHTTTYADILWINLIQYIGDNIFNNQYKNFLNPLIDVIVEAHPYFVSPYNLALNLSPNINADKPDNNDRILRASSALEIGERGMKILCDQRKIKHIETQPFGTKLWENTSLQNPCSDGMLPYLSAYVASELSQNSKAEQYYKIASMNLDSPKASRFLGPLMQAKLGNHREAAEKFLLIALDGYDESPYSCRTIALDILQKLKSMPISRIATELSSLEEKLPPPKDTTNPLALSSTTCYESVPRAMKQIYFAYLSEFSSKDPSIQNGDDLIKKNLLTKIPSLKAQSGWNVIRGSDGLWQYQKPIPQVPKNDSTSN